MLKLFGGAMALIVLAHGADAHGQDAAAATVPDPAYLDYAITDAAATLPDGRRIQIVCMGEGSPTVILTAGMNDWGASWRKVQRPIAEHTRVCSWDRPGVGFSDASDADQTTQATAADLEAALVAADIAGPYIMVGHSLGAYESMTLMDRHPDQVIGFVSVDGSFPDQVARFREGSPIIMAFSDPMEAAETERVSDAFSISRRDGWRSAQRTRTAASNIRPTILRRSARLWPGSTATDGVWPPRRPWANTLTKAPPA